MLLDSFLRDFRLWTLHAAISHDSLNTNLRTNYWGFEGVGTALRDTGCSIKRNQSPRAGLSSQTMCGCLYKADQGWWDWAKQERRKGQGLRWRSHVMWPKLFSLEKGENPKSCIFSHWTSSVWKLPTFLMLPRQHPPQALHLLKQEHLGLAPSPQGREKVDVSKWSSVGPEGIARFHGSVSSPPLTNTME